MVSVFAQLYFIRVKNFKKKFLHDENLRLGGKDCKWKK
jgi:hypothetical protein